MELRHLRYFVAVADELHFGRASNRLHTSQSSLSQQIRNLETELRVELFRRIGRRIELTPAGARFLREARGILATADRAAGLARETAREESRLLLIRRKDFYAIIKKEPSLSVKLLWSFVQVLSDRLRATNNELSEVRQELAAAHAVQPFAEE